MSQPDMIVTRSHAGGMASTTMTAESGWSFGEIGYGVDRKAEQKKAIDAHREEDGLPPVDWQGE